ncbi:putative transthyretin-like protein [Bradyrhizobium sp. STM 3843]|uniref:hydroxyisourate hydrolase n=1 Tax=Bradyrhizobium sp. STM 3843 TaxID=551947 RepID=UPI0002406626|nr:hydroxyisourate hydrolase [Bradyrhizobium sp. STM 3843]CCE04304.1 putative transthyretin-like protein [Bradyrhizobium sp. STM 3843]
MAGGISVHAVDVANGRPAQGLRVEIWRMTPDRTLVADGPLGADGTLSSPVVQGDGVTAGDYEVLFHIGAFFSAHGGNATFLTIVPFRFGIQNAEEHFHLPLKFTPWGYSLFRGA